MNWRGMLKLLIIFITFISSVIFMFITNKDLSIDNISTALLFFFITFDYILIMLRKRFPVRKCIYFISVIVCICFLYHIYLIISEYISWKSFS